MPLDISHEWDRSAPRVGNILVPIVFPAASARQDHDTLG